ncbi:hypothetical protein EVAR_98850_1 [Eumeta japonica]|uniref:Uncharacterized protein n=1 Tax=Eumeta variegata TaxID=151549 RepID=A0A4C2ACQ1_EUMVA|nr:hypothetical protein EVAR_98850_1 [Eumeta japonica]
MHARTHFFEVKLLYRRGGIRIFGSRKRLRPRGGGSRRIAWREVEKARAAERGQRYHAQSCAESGDRRNSLLPLSTWLGITLSLFAVYVEKLMEYRPLRPGGRLLADSSGSISTKRTPPVRCLDFGISLQCNQSEYGPEIVL